MIVLKIGGSVITRKDLEGRCRAATIMRIGREIGCRRNLVLIHGAGSYGHPLARRGESPLRMHSSVCRLNEIFVRSLSRSGAKVIPIHPMSCVLAENGRIKSMRMDVIRKLLEEGCIPVLHGDVVADDAAGFSIISGDQLAVYIAKKLNAKLVGMGTDVDGIVIRGRVLREIGYDELDEVISMVGGSKAVDVTRGMRGKLEEIRALSPIPCMIFNAMRNGEICRFLNGEVVGTLICGRRRGEKSST